MKTWILTLTLSVLLGGVPMTEESIVWTGQLTDWGRPATPYSIIFKDENNNEIGRLYVTSPMRFEGNVDESARLFFEHLIKRYMEPHCK